MSGFRKAKAEQAALKIGLYGPPGSGKTFTSLLLAEGLAQLENKRIAYVDTERGTDFYCKAVSTRPVHPAAFDFDAIYTRRITDIVSEVRSLSDKVYGVIVIDSISHIWESAILAYSGKKTSAGTIPMHQWGTIKKPYKDLMSFLLSSKMHVFLCGRQGTEYATDSETDELRAVGVKMKAEGETPYEPHILIRMESLKPKKTNEVASIVAFIEKDRTGVLSGRSFINPTFAAICHPLLPLLGVSQAYIESQDESSKADVEAMAEKERIRGKKSKQILTEYVSRIGLAKSENELKQVGKLITPQLKSEMTTEDVSLLREAFLARENERWPDAEPERRYTSIPETHTHTTHDVTSMAEAPPDEEPTEKAKLAIGILEHFDSLEVPPEKRAETYKAFGSVAGNLSDMSMEQATKLFEALKKRSQVPRAHEAVAATVERAAKKPPPPAKKENSVIERWNKKKASAPPIEKDPFLEDERPIPVEDMPF